MKFRLGENGATKTEFEYGKLDISGNAEIGYRPYQLLVSSIVGCSAGVYKRILEKKRIDFDSLEVETEVERNPDEVNRITKIHIHFLLTGTNGKQDQLEKSLEIAVRNCSMVQSVKEAIEVVETVEAVE